MTTVIQCNGNRREDYHYVDGETPAFGPPHWVAGAMGNATWSGVRLRDVLKAAGMDVDGISLGTKEPPPRAEQVRAAPRVLWRAVTTSRGAAITATAARDGRRSGWWGTIMTRLATSTAAPSHSTRQWTRWAT